MLPTTKTSEMREPSILIIEDDLTFSTMMKTWLNKKGFSTESVSTIETAKVKLSARPFDLILCDMRLPDADGITILPWLRAKEIVTPLIVMTSYADVQNAVHAMKEGAVDYMSKPIKPDMLLEKIQENLNRKPEPTVKRKTTVNDGMTYIEGQSAASTQISKYVQLVAPTQMSVLINGDSGTGKEYVARRIYQLSNRSDKPFVAIDCGAIPKELAASEFFGHVKGAFTGAVSDKTGAFEEADGGTLFLDEVGNLNYDVQVQLLRALQEHRIRPVGSTREIKINIRLITATNENLKDAIAEGRFREDLYHRLNEFSLRLPTLSERPEDIMTFARFFLKQANEELGKNVAGFSKEAEAALTSYGWPGNLRQLKNSIKRATLLTEGELITPDSFNVDMETETFLPTQAAGRLRNDNEERLRILNALQTARYNKSRAAQILGIDRKTLYNKMKLYEL